jgi:hypothetical protein
MRAYCAASRIERRLTSVACTVPSCLRLPAQRHVARSNDNVMPSIKLVNNVDYIMIVPTAPPLCLLPTAHCSLCPLPALPCSYSDARGAQRDVFRSKYLNVLDFIFGNAGVEDGSIQHVPTNKVCGGDLICNLSDGGNKWGCCFWCYTGNCSAGLRGMHGAWATLLHTYIVHGYSALCLTEYHNLLLRTIVTYIFVYC